MAITCAIRIICDLPLSVPIFQIDLKTAIFLKKKNRTLFKTSNDKKMKKDITKNNKKTCLLCKKKRFEHFPKISCKIY